MTSSAYTNNGRSASPNLYNTLSNGSNKSQSPLPQNKSQYETGGTMTNGWGSSNEEMSDAMKMVDSMQSRTTESSKVLSEMEERILKDSSFGRHENADKWSTLEVCHWLNSIYLNKYANNFSSLSIDGSILLNDLDENMLTTELGIKKIHLKKCLREISKLKEAVQSVQDTQNMFIDLIEKRGTEMNKNGRIEELERQVASLEQINSKLKGNLQILSQWTKQNQTSSQAAQDSNSQNSSKVDDALQNPSQANENDS
ncbi:neurabin-1-like protein [Reticulomyxa filosa]|uniref:Neurabin-1-like protein n=1 Tax=Reticulomyxa filosa TaxID=46433 RepID=X6NR05_RETFI|nr:neurabin-1-like protein [Reticulomyxa filosa]|eukprot:ETO28348.1 neurabin-1-like protein [Reticulomyxa filosa]